MSSNLLTASILNEKKENPTLVQMENSLTKCKNTLSDLMNNRNPLSKKWERQSYNIYPTVPMFNSTWYPISTLPFYLKIPLVVIPLFLSIGDIFINLHNFTIGNLIKLSINVLVPESSILKKEEKRQLHDINNQIKETNIKINRLNRLIIFEKKNDTQKSTDLQNCFNDKDKINKELEKLKTNLEKNQTELDQINQELSPLQTEYNNFENQIEMAEKALEDKKKYEQGTYKGSVWNAVIPRMPQFLGGNPYYSFTRQLLEETKIPELITKRDKVQKKINQIKPNYDKANNNKTGLIEQQNKLIQNLTQIDKQIKNICNEIDLTAKE